MKKVLIGISGGVDSSVAAILLRDAGFVPVGCTLLLHRHAEKDIADAKAVCQRLDIEHHVLDLRDKFETLVVSNFIDEYLKGNTPNPCVFCNRHMKFAYMLDFADKLGCQYIATGHYARKAVYNDKAVIQRGKDLSKDQSYVLWSLTHEQVERTLFPLADISKEQVREIAEQYGLVSAQKKDSQDICFVPDGNYAEFIEAKTGIPAKHGAFVDLNGNMLGEHNGIIRYTIGQRKGLGIALGKPAFVLEKDATGNTVTLDTDESLLFYRRVLVKNTNFHPFETLTEPIRVSAKLRYRHEAQPALLSPAGDGALIEFDEPQRAPSAGQSAVFYNGDILLGGGIIVKGLKDNE